MPAEARVTVEVGSYYDQWVASATTATGAVVAFSQENSVNLALQALVAELRHLGYAVPAYGEMTL